MFLQVLLRMCNSGDAEWMETTPLSIWCHHAKSNQLLWALFAHNSAPRAAPQGLQVRQGKPGCLLLHVNISLIMLLTAVRILHLSASLQVSKHPQLTFYYFIFWISKYAGQSMTVKVTLESSTLLGYQPFISVSPALVLLKNTKS